jgi:hypothetical protein
MINGSAEPPLRNGRQGPALYALPGPGLQPGVYARDPPCLGAADPTSWQMAANPKAPALIVRELLVALVFVRVGLLGNGSFLAAVLKP